MFAAADACPEQSFQNTATKYNTLNDLIDEEAIYLSLLHYCAVNKYVYLNAIIT